MTVGNTARLAVLIDGDNVPSKNISKMLTEIAKYGTASVKRIYGDWTETRLNGWKSCLAEHSIQPIQQFANTTGKNATDGAMIIDAMDLLYTGRFSGFCIVSSDGDFARLATRIREHGVTVYGFGERKTPRPFITACEKFVYFDVLNTPGEKGSIAPTAQAAAKAKTMKKAGDKTLHAMLTTAISAVAGEEDGRANLASVGAHLAKQAADFDVRNYGFTRLSELVEASGIVDVERTGDANKIVLVRLKPAAE
ncbi:MAG: NYN domain-containing protein [Xanthobacteraceae bacterium]